MMGSELISLRAALEDKYVVIRIDDDDEIFYLVEITKSGRLMVQTVLQDTLQIHRGAVMMINPEQVQSIRFHADRTNQPGLFTAATGARESPDPKTQFWPLAPFATA